MELIFYKASQGNIYDKMIAAATCGRYSHVEIKFNDGICFSSSPRDGGTRFKQINVSPKNWDIVNLKISSEQENNVRFFCEKEVDKEYDWLAISCFLLPVNVNDAKKWYCSEICSTVLIKEKILYTKNDKFSPSSLYKIVKEQYDM